MTALALLVRYWREAAIVALFATCIALTVANLHKADQLRLCKQARANDAATVAATTAHAQAADLAHARAVERRNATATQETESDLQAQLAAARTAAADYARRMHDQPKADRGGGDAAGMPVTPDPAGGAADANRASLLDDDLRICSENTVKLEGWGKWWAKVSTPMSFAEP